MDTNYFVCTLGQAALLNKTNPHDFETINQFIDARAMKYSEFPAIGFPKPSKAGDSWGQHVFTFLELQRGSYSTAIKFARYISVPTEANQCVALLCPSSVEFLFAWLGLIRLGHSVLLIAPQSQAPAISHLCQSCNVTTLFYEPSYEHLAKATSSVETLPLPFDCDTLDLSHFQGNLKEPSTSASSVAYLHHTSGTSTGLPKPISQSHHAAVGVLPCLQGNSEAATFSTTPLYHGGVADCFRSWTSAAMIWLFPGKDVPITADNILKSLDLARSSSNRNTLPPVKYFSSVPYVLQMLASDQRGMEYLTTLDNVGVGGAALPPAVGHDLVCKGVNLVSRFGSAECGFLMSSHRDYVRDTEWQYLRSNSGAEYLRFENYDDGLAELVVLPGWPHRAKKNREDGSFATSDLFERHPTIPNAWRYHSRADSQLTLSTGKKFDPAPMEAAILVSSPLLRDVFIFGNGKNYPGALLFCSSEAKDMTRSQILDAVWPHISKANAESHSHARLSKAMLFVVPFEEEEPLEKSSKGTVLRIQAEKRYAQQIAGTYQTSNGTPASPGEVTDNKLPSAVSDIVQEVTGKSIDKDADLFQQGVDSVACMQIRDHLMALSFNTSSCLLPLNVVYDCGTIQGLTDFLISHRKGETLVAQDELELMRSLVSEYGQFETRRDDQSFVNGHVLEKNEEKESGRVIVLTGATGALGAHLLALLRSDPSVSRVYCLLRAVSGHAARERVTKSLRSRLLPSLDSPDPVNHKIICVPCKLSGSDLGLDPSLYHEISSTATVIIHAAWAVNFSLRLRSFIQDHVAGTQHLLNLAFSSFSSRHRSHPRFLFCSSTASVLGPGSTSPIPENISNDPATSSPLGYSRSKWVAEQICNEASKAERNLDIRILRIGQLCGDTVRGVWNHSEAWPLMLSSASATGCLPDLGEEETLGWLPVDVAARAVVDVALSQNIRDGDSRPPEAPVYHVLNADRTTSWSDLLGWIKKVPGGADFEVVEPEIWLERLDRLEGDHPAKKLLGMWRGAYGEQDRNSEGENKKSGAFEFELGKTKKEISAMRDVQPIGETQVRLIWAWIRSEMMGK